MRPLLIVGGGLFGSLAAAYARHRGIEATVFDAGLQGAASPAAAGLFQEKWAGKKFHAHYQHALPLLEELYPIESVCLLRDDGSTETLLFIPPRVILEPAPQRRRVTAIGDGWLETDGQRHEGWVYIAAGIWCGQLVPRVTVHGKAGAAFAFAGERPGRLHQYLPRRHALAFVRDPGTTYFSDGTAESVYTAERDQQTLSRAAQLGLTEPIKRYWGCRPYAPGGPLFQKLGQATWLATGGRKLGTILGAWCARRLIEEELSR